MSTTSLSYLLEDARRALAAGRLRCALSALAGTTGFSAAAAHAEAVEDVKRAYETLLRFMELGADDPTRAEMHRKFMLRAEELCDDIDRSRELAEGTTPFALAWRALQNAPDAPMTLADALGENRRAGNGAEDGDGYRRRFDFVWTAPRFTPVEADDFVVALSGEAVDEPTACLLVSALTLHLLHGFDAERYRALALLASLPAATQRLKARLVVGWVFATLRHADRLAANASLAALAELTLDEPGMAAAVEQLQMQLFLTLETKNIERELREHIMPEVMKRTRELRLDRFDSPDTLAERMAEADLNPEWEKDGSRSQLGEKMRRIFDMQQRGADVFIGQFKMLKQRFPFFQTVANWFYPFTPNHPALKQNGQSGATAAAKLMERLAAQAPMCDSDKYSLMLFMEVMPQAGMAQLAAQLDQMMEQHADAFEAIKSRGEQEANVTPAEALRAYVQDFYRFATLFRQSQSFYNPFGHNLVLTDYPPFSRLLADSGLPERLGHFVFDDKSYALALALYKGIAEAERSATVWQRIGFCCERLKQLDEAAAAYERAALLQPESAWTERRLARVLTRSGKCEAALARYEHLEALTPDDAAPATLAVLQGAAECCMRLERYDEAFRRLFKIDYLAPETPGTAAAIAWCSVLTGKLEQAERYYAKVLAAKPGANDFVNAGHAAWLAGNTPLAVERYRSAIAAEPSLRPTADNAEADLFAHDLALLQNGGISALNVALMRDILSE